MEIATDQKRHSQHA
jgi:hypothetical protein